MKKATTDGLTGLTNGRRLERLAVDLSRLDGRIVRLV